MKIGVGSVVKAKVGNLEEITKEERIRSMSKEVVGCIQSVVGKKKFLVQLEYGKKKEISSSLLVFLSLMRRLIRMSQYHTSPKDNKVDC